MTVNLIPCYSETLWSSLVAHQVRDPAFPLLWLRSQLWRQLNPWSGNFHMLWQKTKQRNTKQNKKTLIMWLFVKFKYSLHVTSIYPKISKLAVSQIWLLWCSSKRQVGSAQRTDGGTGSRIKPGWCRNLWGLLEDSGNPYLVTVCAFSI